MPNRRAADVLADTLLAHGVDRAFCVPGESYLALLDALHDRPGIDLVVARHESGAGFMAAADARCTGRPGICLVSHGPGAANAAIAIHSAEQDATPLVVFIGQVRRTDRGRGAFQEIDYSRMFGGIAKDVCEVLDGRDLPAAFADAHATALSGTPGPVVLVVPEDVFDDDVDVAACEPRARSGLAPSEEAVEAVAREIARASRPLVIAGGALDSRAGRDALRRAARCHHLPVALSYKRQDLFDNADPLFAGYLGFKIPRAHIDALRETDLVLALGTRLPDVTTQNYDLPRAPVPLQALVHVYPDAAQLGRVFKTDVAIAADPVRLLERLSQLGPLDGQAAREAWASRLHERVADRPAYVPTARQDGVEFGAMVQALARRADPTAVVAMDGGNFGGWVHRLWPWTPANRLIGTAAGAMGMGVPGAVAAALRHPDRQVLAFVGDGGFMMTGVEIATAVQREARLVVVVSNNRCFATIRQQQELAYPGRVAGSDLPAIDFAQLGEACGARGFRVRTLDEIDGVASAALAVRGVALIDVDTSLEAISAYTTLTAIHLRHGAGV
jgi:acetolactate synthase I/II/III large subunit